MSSQCERSFPEEHLTGYLDGMLTQGDRQRVRLHLEECTTCATEVRDMQEQREMTMGTKFETDDLQWDERPKGGVSRWMRGGGLLLLLLWLIGILAVSVWLPQGDTEILVGRVLGALGLTGGLALFVSVLLDRLHVAPKDRYRGVKK